MAANLKDVCGKYQVESEENVKEFFAAVCGNYLGSNQTYLLSTKGDGLFTETIYSDNKANTREFAPSVQFQRETPVESYTGLITFDAGTLTEKRWFEGKEITITRKFEGDKVCTEFSSADNKVCGKTIMKKVS